LLFLVLAVVPAQVGVHAASGPRVIVKSEYTLNRSGYAVVNETVTYNNNSTGSLTTPSVTLGLGNLSSKVVSSFLTGSGFSMTSASPGGPFSVQGGGSVAAGANSSFTISALVSGIVSTANNGSLDVLTLSSPSVSIPVGTLREEVIMPASTAFVSPPEGLGGEGNGNNNVYSKTLDNVTQGAAVTSVRTVAKSTIADFHPLDVFKAKRTISVGSDGSPMVTDTISFKNLGTSDLSTLYLSPLTTGSGQVTVIPAAEPRLLNPVTATLADGALNLVTAGVSYAIPADSNYSLAYQYPLQAKYYTVSGGQVTVNIPDLPPIQAFVDSYSIVISAPSGVTVVQAPSQTLSNVSPWQTGTTTMVYSLALGWALDSAVPAASVVFVLLLIGLFVARTQVTEEEETEEETSTERASDMIKAFDEKTNLINGLWSEIAAKDPNSLSKEYFDELRGRLDAFRSKALQRLNEVKQKSTTQKFFDLLNQIHATEREVDRAAKDKLNLYEQFYLRRMRKDVFDRLLPQYTKRLEKALNQLSDELHVVQKEAKLL
jgi:uncharacterized membrane protein